MDEKDIAESRRRYGHIDGFEERLQKHLELRRAEQLRYQKSLPGFLEELRKIVAEEAPKWTMEPVDTYSFPKAHAFAQDNFPAQYETKDFVEVVVKGILTRLSRTDSYSEQALEGWYLAVLSNTLRLHKQQDVVLKEALPHLWEKMLQNGSGVRIGDLSTPAVLDMLHQEDHSILLAETDALLAKHFQYKGIMNYVIRPFTQLRAHLGVYSLDKPKQTVIAHFIENLGFPEAVGICADGQHGWISHAHFIQAGFNSLSQEGCKKLASELDRQLGTDQIIEDLSLMLQGYYKKTNLVFPLFALRLLPSLMRHLPEDKMQSYARQLEDKLGSKLIGCIAGTMSWMSKNVEQNNFINSLPEEQGRSLVQMMVRQALAADYTAADGNYGHLLNSYTERMNFATTLHTIIPEKHQAIFEREVIDYLSALPNEKRQEGLLKATILLRHPLANNGRMRTQEADFYPSSRKTRVVVYIKPQVASGASGLVTTDSFIGTLEDYRWCLDRRSGFAPRDEPPNKREVYPPEFHNPLYPVMLGIESEILSAVPQPALPSLLEVLVSRQPKGHISLRPALPYGAGQPPFSEPRV